MMSNWNVNLFVTFRCDQLDGDPKEVSPIFTQFLECVWQLSEQFPQVCVDVVCMQDTVTVTFYPYLTCKFLYFFGLVFFFFLQAFEFSEWFLLQIHEHVHSCQYGNFLGNNQRQREDLQ